VAAAVPDTFGKASGHVGDHGAGYVRLPGLSDKDWHGVEGGELFPSRSAGRRSA